MISADPLFWALAIAAVLIVGIAKGGFGGGIGIIGVPMLAMVTAPARAAAILLPILVLMDLFAVRAFWGRWDAVNLRLLWPGAVFGTLLGFLGFRVLSADLLRLLIGVLAIAYVLTTLLRRSQRPARPAERGRALLWGSLSGFTSFSIHAGGPPLQMYLLPQQLDKTSFQSTTAAFFCAVNLLKLPLFAWLGQLDLHNLASSLVLAPLAPLGIALGRALHARVSEALFFHVVRLSLFAIGVRLIAGALGLV